MIPEKDLVVNYLRKQGWDADLINGVVVVYNAPYEVIEAEVRGIGYKASFGVTERNDWPADNADSEKV